MNEEEKKNIEKFLEFAKQRRKRQQITVVSTNQLAEMLGIIHAENMKIMFYSMSVCGLKKKDWELKEKYYRHRLEDIFGE